MAVAPQGHAYDQAVLTIPDQSAQAGGRTLVASASKTRLNNTTAYSVGQIVSESTTTGTAWTFSNVTLGTGGAIGSALLTDSALQTTTPQFKLILFSALPSCSLNDAAAFAPSAADLALIVAEIDLVNWIGFNANGILLATEINRLFNCASGSTTLYGVLIAANAYTPVANEKFGITLGISDG